MNHHKIRKKLKLEQDAAMAWDTTYGLFVGGLVSGLALAATKWAASNDGGLHSRRQPTRRDGRVETKTPLG